METKKQLLDNVIKDIKKRYGEESINKMDEKNKINIPVIPTGILSLDIAIGAGGFPRGRIIEIYGPESSGKTTIALSALAQCQKMGGTVAFVDAEHALDPEYSEKLGVNLKDLYVAQPDSGEQALEITETLVKSGAIDMVVVDSVAALVPKSEIEGSMGDPQMGMQARLMSQALRKITAAVNKSKSCVIFINQLRMKIGGYGNPETTTGGMALKFYASIRLEIRKGETLKDKDEVYGHYTKIKVAKNKIAPPFKTCETLILFGKGPYNIASIVDEAVSCDLIQKSGTWYAYQDQKLGQGKDNVFKFLEENPDIAKKLEKQVREHYHLPLNIEEKSSQSNKSEDVEEPPTKKTTSRSKKKTEEEYL
ncbi:protein RecA-like [Periplaneta americana]|uniref:protein RecA-like n=1 Tax=Periplaneta americana TaxID=6978 RepID=UPI0037E968F5